MIPRIELVALVLAVAVAMAALPSTGLAGATADADTSGTTLLGVSMWPPELTTLGAVWSPQIRINSRIGVGLGAETLVPYRLKGQTNEPVSSYSLYVMGTTKNQWRFDVANSLYWRDGRFYSRVRFDHDNLARQYFGVGPTTPGDDSEVYRPQSTMLYVEGTVAIGEHLALGPRLEVHHQAIHQAEAGGELARGAVRGAGESMATGAGLIASYDRRDCRLRPCEGAFGQAMLMAFFDGPGDHPFQLVHFDLRGYVPIARAQTLAMQLFYYGISGDAPFWRLASLGGRSHSRAYSRDRWLDEVLLAAQAEWRLRIVRRLGVVAFAGAAVVDHDPWTVQARNVRPSIGLGVRVFPGLEEGTVPVRLDLAFGHRDARLELAVGDAF